MPDYVDDLTEGRGRLGFLETEYHIVDRVREADRGGRRQQGLRPVGHGDLDHEERLTMVVGTITIIVLTFFMLLEGPTWIDRFYSLFSARPRSACAAIVGNDIVPVVGGYVTGNLLISVIAGTLGLVLWIMDVPFALALGLLVALLDSSRSPARRSPRSSSRRRVRRTDSIWAGIVVLVFFVVYQQIENHLLQPLVYGRTVQLSPLSCSSPC